MAAINLPFAASATKRAPTTAELADGYGCGPADLELFDFMGWWTTGQIDKAIEDSGQTTDDADLTQLSKAIQAFAAGGQCQLRYVSATAITLFPKGGNLVKVAGKAVALPGAGVTAANTSVLINGSSGTLANTTTYLVALNASGALEFWTLATGHGPDTTAGNVGVEVITGHADKTLVGMIHTNGSGQFADSATTRQVISWFNRREIAGVGVATPGSTTASVAVFVELSTSSRILFICWGDEATKMKVIGQASNSLGTFSTGAAVGLDGAYAGQNGSSYAASAGQSSYTGGDHDAILTEGFHYLTPVGAVGAGGTGTFAVTAFVNLRG